MLVVIVNRIMHLTEYVPNIQHDDDTLTDLYTVNETVLAIFTVIAKLKFFLQFSSHFDYIFSVLLF